MMISAKILSLWGREVIIRARAQVPHVIIDTLTDEACFYYVLEGHSVLFTPTQKLEVLHKEGVSLQCGNYVGKFFASADEKIAEILIVKLDKNILKKIYLDDLPALFEKIKQNKANRHKEINNSFMLHRYVEGLLFYIENPHLAIEELLVLKIRELFILLANTDSSEAIQRIIDGLFQESNIVFKQIIERNIFTGLKLQELAHLCAMSVSTFKRRFKKEYGTSPHQYFFAKKMEQSKVLIENSDLPFFEIAEQCGFTEYSNFSAAFKKYFKAIPSSFR